jgi:hypothetical protein
LREAVRKKLKERKEAARKAAKESEAAKAKTAPEAGKPKKAKIYLRLEEKRFILAFVQALVNNGLEQKDAIAELHKAFNGLYKHVTASSLYDFHVAVQARDEYKFAKETACNRREQTGCNTLIKTLFSSKILFSSN